MNIQLHLDIDPERITNLLSCAFEDGSAYWASVRSDLSDKRGQEFWFEAPMAGGHIGIVLKDPEDGPINDAHLWTVDQQACERGLKLMAEKHPRHFAEFMRENEDAETGDVFLQCVCFGELVFG